MVLAFSQVIYCISPNMTNFMSEKLHRIPLMHSVIVTSEGKKNDAIEKEQNMQQLKINY